MRYYIGIWIKKNFFIICKIPFSITIFLILIISSIAFQTSSGLRCKRICTSQTMYWIFLLSRRTFITRFALIAKYLSLFILIKSLCTIVTIIFSHHFLFCPIITFSRLSSKNSSNSYALCARWTTIKRLYIFY